MTALPKLTWIVSFLACGWTASAASHALDLRPAATVGVQDPTGVQARTPGQRLRSAGVSPAVPDADGTVRRTELSSGASRVAPLAVGDALSFRLFDDVETRLVLRERMESPLGGEAFLAAADGDKLLAAVVLQAADGSVSLNVTDLKRKRVYAVTIGPSGVTVCETDPMSGTRTPLPSITPDLATVTNGGPVQTSGRAKSLLAADQSSTLVDMLVAYDRNAAAWANQNGGGLTNFATMAVQKANAALANTGLSTRFRFRLVGVLAVDADGGNDLASAVDAARSGSGEWGPVREERNRVGADIVTVLVDTGMAYGTTGIGFSLASGMDVSAFAESAYNACAVRAVAQSHTLTHEIGHNLGAGHATAQTTQTGPQYYDYSAGYYFTVSGTKYHTIMAYDYDGYGNIYLEAPYFSSPDHTYEGVAVGDAKHDNTRTIANTCAAASQWRKQVVPMSYDVYFSPAGGSTFTGSITVSLTAGKAGLPIRYTLDGSTPTSASTLYSAPITLTQTTTIRAVTVTDGVAGPIFEATYSVSDLGAGLDAPHLPWRTSEEYPWIFETTDTYDGVDAVRSTDGGDYRDQPSWLETTVTAPTVMSFRYRTHYYSGHAEFSVCVDDTKGFSENRSTDDEWRLAEVSIPSGSHTVRFTSELKGGRTLDFNGVWLDQVRFDALSRPPTISPETTTDLKAAHVFTNSMSVTLTPPEGRVGQLFYTTDGSDPSGKDARAYDGPFELTQSAHVRAIFVEGGKDASVEVGGYYLERHPVRPGEWTTDVDGVRAAAAKDGSIICILTVCHATCYWSQRLYPVAHSSSFLNWAAENGVYLVTCDESLHCDAESAESWFWTLYWSVTPVPSEGIYYTALFFARPSEPDVLIGKGLAMTDEYVGTVKYDDTPESLIAGFASILGVTPPSSLPSVTADGNATVFTPGSPRGFSVPNSWAISKGYASVGGSTYQLENTLRRLGANGLARYESYLYGLEPDASTPAEEQLKVTLEGFDSKGLPIIRSTPEPNDKSRVRVTKLGKAELGGATWTEVTDANKADMRFFKVKYEIVP